MVGSKNVQKLPQKYSKFANDITPKRSQKAFDFLKGWKQERGDSHSVLDVINSCGVLHLTYVHVINR
jgi:hypothetical protein